jgi:hypothetical protein
VEEFKKSVSFKATNNVLTGLSIFLYLLSLTQDAFYIDQPDYAAWASSGWLVLIGWIGALMGGGAALTWFANPLLFFSWVILPANKMLAIVASSVAAVLAASFLLFEKVITSEAPTYSLITHRGAGYWLWLCSCVVFPAGLWASRIWRTTGRNTS